MSDNVFIKIREHGKLVDIRIGHNVWVDRGRQFLAELVALTSQDPDVGERDDRVRFFGVGIGGVKQGAPSIADVPPLSTAYPAGADPSATSGNEYNDAFPFNPDVTTLERPVRITGGSNPYSSAALTDVWLVDAPKLFFTHLTPTELTVHAILDGAGGDVVYAPFTQVPLSEAGLFTSEVGVNINSPFNLLVAYITFGTILMTSSIELEFIWSVKF